MRRFDSIMVDLHNKIQSSCHIMANQFEYWKDDRGAIAQQQIREKIHLFDNVFNRVESLDAKIIKMENFISNNNVF